MDLQLRMQSVPITTKVVSSNPTYGQVYSIQQYVIKFINDLWQVDSYWNNSPRVDMSLHSDTLFWFRGNQSLLFLLNAACLAEKQQISIVFGLTRERLLPMGYRTRGEHANHYATDAV
jgi:hypothetical protein